jgi:uncharacterized integral membrane protein
VTDLPVAESVSLDGGAIAVILGVLVLLLLALAALIVGGFTLARRAGRGDSAVELWVALVVVELLLLARAWRAPLLLLVLGTAILGQVLAYFSARSGSDR